MTSDHIKSTNKKLKHLKKKMKKYGKLKQELAVARKALEDIKNHRGDEYDDYVDMYAECKCVADMAIYYMDKISLDLKGK